jgi:hypothetical protein
VQSTAADILCPIIGCQPAATCRSLLQTFGEFLDPIAHVHFNVEGTIEFTSMLFIPGMAPFEQQNWSAKSRSIKLYVRRVFISDEFDEDLMPRWVKYICIIICWVCWVVGFFCVIYVTD